MVKYTQTIRRQFADELFECGHFVGLVFKGLSDHHLMNELNLRNYRYFEMVSLDNLSLYL